MKIKMGGDETGIKQTEQNKSKSSKTSFFKLRGNFASSLRHTNRAFTLGVGRFSAYVVGSSVASQAVTPLTTCGPSYQVREVLHSTQPQGLVPGLSQKEVRKLPGFLPKFSAGEPAGRLCGTGDKLVVLHAVVDAHPLLPLHLPCFLDQDSSRIVSTLRGGLAKWIPAVSRP
jgi:hypothetical protein